MKKLAIFFALLPSLLSSASQAASLLEQQVTLHAHEQTLEIVLYQISRQTGIQFSYNSSAVDASQYVSIDVNGKPANEVLQQLLANKYEYKIRRKYVILKKNQVSITPLQHSDNLIVEKDTVRYNYISNQQYVEEFCYSDSGTVLGSCPIITNDKNLEVMNKHLAAIMLAATTTMSAQAQETPTIKEQLAKAGKDFTTIVVEAADGTKQAVKIAVDEISKQTASVKVAVSQSNTKNNTTAGQAEVTEVASKSDEAAMQPISEMPAEAKAEEPTKTQPTNVGTKVTATPDSVRPFLFTIIYPFSFPELHSEKYTYNVALNLFVGYNGGVKGAEIGWLANVNRYSMSGFQGAGIANICLGNATGMQAAGIANFAAKDTAVAQFAGVVNIAQSARFQVAGVTNAAYENAQLQLAGIANFSAKGNTALQVGGIANTANTSNFQLAGIASVAKQADVQISGIANASAKSNIAQISGIVNVADTSSIQIGLVNAARKSGTQIGLVNVCDTSSGIMIGLVNVARKGALREFEISGSYSTLSAAYRMGTHKFYSFAEVSYKFDNDLWMYGLGLGSQIDFQKNWGMNIEALFQTVTNDISKTSGFNGLSQLRVLGYKRFAKHFTVFAGPTLMVYNSELDGENAIDFRPAYTLYSHKSGNTSTDIWAGFSVGLRF